MLPVENLIKHCFRFDSILYTFAILPYSPQKFLTQTFK